MADGDDAWLMAPGRERWLDLLFLLFKPDVLKTAPET